MDPFVELLKQINIAQVFVIFAAFWMFYKRLDNKIEHLEKKLENKIERLDCKSEERNKELKNEFSTQINKLGEKVEDVDRRLCRIEGSLATHGHCLFNQAKPEQKAE